MNNWLVNADSRLYAEISPFWQAFISPNSHAYRALKLWCSIHGPNICLQGDVLWGAQMASHFARLFPAMFLGQLKHFGKFMDN